MRRQHPLLYCTIHTASAPAAFLLLHVKRRREKKKVATNCNATRRRRETLISTDAMILKQNAGTVFYSPKRPARCDGDGALRQWGAVVGASVPASSCPWLSTCSGEMHGGGEPDAAPATRNFGHFSGSPRGRCRGVARAIISAATEGF